MARRRTFMELRRDLDYLAGISRGATHGATYISRHSSAWVALDVVDAPVGRRAADADEGHATPRISPRERAVLQQLAAGASTEKAARELLLSPHTVRSHLKTVRRKWGRGLAPMRSH